ncbi:MAG: hypothetical protein JW843_02930, partial [Candidatus Aminicenantes bacterium]|nr:hypothetical protein [Candidatus Aminicenantes bacterium]
HNADNALASFRFKHKDLKIESAEKEFEAGGRKWNAGTFVLKASGNPAGLEAVLDAAGKEFGLPVLAVPAVPDVPMHDIAVPRIAVMHTWQSTQTEGWVRIALDELGVPYDYISVHAARDNARLRDKYDVILFGPSSGDAMSLVNGLSGNKPQSWKKTEITPNIGVVDSSDDIRGGLDLEGIVHLRDFIKDGGLFITLTNTSALPIHFGFAPGLAVRQTPDLIAGGSVFRAVVADKNSPVVYGYGESLGVYFSQAPVLGFGGAGGFGGARGRAPGGRTSGRGSLTDPDIAQGRPRDLGQKEVEEFRKTRPSTPEAPRGMAVAAGPRPKVILSFDPKAANLLISGGLAGGEALAGTPTLIDAPLGAGHVLIFGFNPMWRHQTHGSFALVTNAMLNWKNLTPPPPPAPEKK